MTWDPPVIDYRGSGGVGGPGPPMGFRCVFARKQRKHGSTHHRKSLCGVVPFDKSQGKPKACVHQIRKVKQSTRPNISFTFARKGPTFTLTTAPRCSQKDSARMPKSTTFAPLRSGRGIQEFVLSNNGGESCFAAGGLHFVCRERSASQSHFTKDGAAVQPAVEAIAHASTPNQGEKGFPR